MRVHLKKIAIIAALAFVFATVGPMVLAVAQGGEGNTVIATVYKTDPSPDPQYKMPTGGPSVHKSPTGGSPVYKE